MKKYLFILFLFNLVLSNKLIFSQKKWEYPVKPFTKEWNDLKNMDEIRAVQQIPESVLIQMSTEELFDAWMDLPGRIEILAYNTLQQGFELNIKHFNVLSELLARNDAGIVIVERYLKMEPEKVNEASPGRGKGRYMSDYGFTEFLLSQASILNNIPQNEITRLLKKIIDDIEIKIMLTNDNFWLETGVVLAGRLIKYHNINNNIKEILHKDIELRQTLSTGEVRSKEIFDQLFKCAKKCIY